jgi:2-iminobutanoate/2-iminopropanoate deaminase
MRTCLTVMSISLSVGIGLLVVPAAAASVASAEEPALHFYNSPAAAAAKVPFSQAVRVGDVLYLSGSLGSVPGTRQLVPGGIEAETTQTMENISTVLKANGLSFDDVFKCTVMLADMAKWEAFNKVYVTYFKPDRLPARSAFGASGLALGAQVELECWAYAGKR